MKLDKGQLEAKAQELAAIEDVDKRIDALEAIDTEHKNELADMVGKILEDNKTNEVDEPTAVQIEATKYVDMSSEEREKTLTALELGNDAEYTKEQLVEVIIDLLKAKVDAEESDEKDNSDEKTANEGDKEDSQDSNEESDSDGNKEDVDEENKDGDEEEDGDDTGSSTHLREKGKPEEKTKRFSIIDSIKKGFAALTGLKPGELVKAAKSEGSSLSDKNLKKQSKDKILEHIEGLRVNQLFNKLIQLATEAETAQEWAEAKELLEEAIEVAPYEVHTEKAEAMLAVVEKAEEAAIAEAAKVKKDAISLAKKGGRKPKRVDDQVLIDSINKLIIQVTEAQEYERANGKISRKYSRLKLMLNRQLRRTFRV